MFSNKHYFYGRLSKTFPILKLIDIYDKNSFIREYVLDNIFICLFMYIFFYFAIWYAHKVIERIEKKNNEMLETVERNRIRLDDIISLRDKRAEYEEMVINAKNAQKAATKQLDSEIKRLSVELVTTSSKLNELEKFLCKWKFWKSCTERTAKKAPFYQGEFWEGIEITDSAYEGVKILEPSFPPQRPPEPPPRKFGVFARPPTAASDAVPRYHVGQGDRIRNYSTSLSSLAPVGCVESPSSHRYRARTRAPFTPSTQNSPITNPDNH